MKLGELRQKTNVKFIVSDSRYFVAKLKEVPEFSDSFFAIIKYDKEVTVVAKEGTKLNSTSEERFFRLITFDILLPFSLTGFLSHVCILLSREEIPILAFSAYSTDHILVNEKNLTRAVEALEKDGMVQGKRDDV
jgi:uncharacterized protein